MHSRIAPSSASRWVNCTGSVHMESFFPESSETDSAAEGHVAHDIAARVLTGQGQLTECTSEEMHENLKTYISDVHENLADACEFQVEKRVQCARIHKESFGTVDAYALTPFKLIVWDLKYGYALVDAYENWQMLNYSSGLLDLYPQVTNVEFRIVQPRAFSRMGPVRVWSVNTKSLTYYHHRLHRAAHQALSQERQCATGVWCRYCRARHACPTLQEATYAIMDTHHAVRPHELTNEQLSQELAHLQDSLKQLEYRKIALEEQLTAKMKAGARVAGWTLKTGVGRKKWKRDPKEIINMGELMGVDLVAPLQPITPAAAVKAGLDPAVVQAYVAPLTGVKLERDEGKDARRIFGGN